MFLDLHNAWPPPEPWSPPSRPRMTKTRERMIGWLLGFNLLMLLVGPLAGASVLEILVPLFKR
ncbi:MULTISPECIES: hypothetical protein [unclassified Sphingomonas]|uniref:hypothetical protein n=1 Tax=unclassified Sphingomonas TaxID=196159 RepID=UPI001F57E839|nr:MULTISPECIES: hypothetical protein [unclassified Sphingomonas]